MELFSRMRTATSVGAGIVLLVASAPAQEALTRVSLDSNGAEANPGYIFSPPSVSAAGRYVAFDSSATNLVAGDGNGYHDIFVHDRETGATVRVNVSSTGAEADNFTFGPSISGDGRFVAFNSYASNLVANYTSVGGPDVYVHDRDPDDNGIFDEGNGVTTLESVSSTGERGDSYSMHGSISADGKRIAFESFATNLVTGDQNEAIDVFVHDRTTGVTTRASVSSTGAEGEKYYPSALPVISADGNVVVFESYAANLVADDTNQSPDLFEHDLATGVTERVSVDSSGAQSRFGSTNESSLPAVSADGSVVAFASYADDLVSDDTNGSLDIFVHDRTTGATTRASVDSSGIEANRDCTDLAISADGQLVAFSSYAENLVPNDRNFQYDVFVHDRVNATTEAISVDCSGAFGYEDSFFAALSADGNIVAFVSRCSNLVLGDTNDAPDVFARDRSIVEPDASWSNYGVGFPGTLGVPSLTASADPAFGTTFSIEVGNSLGFWSVGFLLLGLESAAIPTGKGGTILVDIDLLEPIVLPPSGDSIPADVPYEPELCGISVYLQVIEVDPGAQRYLAFTPGMELVIGH